MAPSIFAQNIFILFVFTVLYNILYRYNKHFLLNRIYILLSVLFSIIIPFLAFNVFPYKKIVPSTDKNIVSGLSIPNDASTDWILVIYLIGFGLSLLFFIYRVFKVISLISKTDFEKNENFKITNNHYSTYSFFRYIFITNKEDLIVLNHELTHASKYHSLDILLIELAKCVLWFNPFIYILKYYLQENHEFEADYCAMNKKNIDEVTMAEYLLKHAKNRITSQLLITNNFFSLTKNRVKMLAKNKFSKKVTYAFSIPVFLLILSAFTFKSYPVYVNAEGQIVQDTLVPGYFTSIDTIVSYDPDTKKETLKIVESKISMDEYLKQFKFSGKLSSRIDTIPFYDPDTKTESIMVEKIKYPFELRFIFHKLTWPQQKAIIKQYGSSTTKIVEE